MCKILIIEEDMQRRRLFAEELKREGNQIIAVHRGKQANEFRSWAADYFLDDASDFGRCAYVTYTLESRSRTGQVEG